MHARIYQKYKTQTQSGKKSSQLWILKFIGNRKDFVEPVMGWTGGYNTLADQVSLTFNSKIEATNYAIERGIQFEIIDSTPHKITHQSYIQNFL